MILRLIRCLLAFIAIASTFSVTAAEAAAVRSGGTLVVIAATMNGNAVGYDSTNHVYLVVGTFGRLYGRFTAADGTPIGSPFVIQASTNFTHFPSVAFSPDADGGAGGFLVAWHESDLPAGNTSVHARIVSVHQNGPAGPDNVLNTDGSWWNSHVTVAYGTQNKEFVVAFALVHPVYGIRATRVSNTGAAVAPTFTITKNSQFEDNPGIAYNPNTNQFLVSYSGYDPVGAFAFVDTRLVQGGTSQLVGASATRLGVTVGTWITAVTYNPLTNKYLVVWFGADLTSTGTYGRLVNADGTVGGNVIPVSARWKCHDGLDAAYNVNSNTYFVISCDVSSSEDGGVELTGNALPINAGFIVSDSDPGADTNDEGGNFHPRIAASTDAPNWLVTTTNNYTSVLDQLVTSGPVSTPVTSIDLPSAKAIVSPTGFVIAGWAIDEGATTSTGIDVVAAWAFPTTGGAAILAGIAQLGISRPDVGAAFGSQFSTAGFGLTATLPAGTYNLAIYSHSVISGTWSNPTVITITVRGPVSNPKMSLDMPSNGATAAASGFTVGGWALDLGATSGTGVDVVDVWAYPSTGAAPVLIGVATYGGPRPDVGAAFGSPSFTASGFGIQGVMLPVGDYVLAAFAHSTVTGTFNDVVTASIHVR
ncbi:MAG TPA: hypothetical protein VFZ98_13010 [Vicinamibacterales bacterium]